MSVRYIEPLSRAVDRAVEICFRPFNLAKWFVLGFACWLARLVQGGGGGGGSFPTPPIGDREAEGAAAVAAAPEWLESLDPEMLFGGAALVFVLGCVAIFLFVILPLLLWISSRGEFIFLDDVVHNKAEIKAPWNEFKAEGNSLFLWRLGYILVVILAVALAASPMILYLVKMGDEPPGVAVGLLFLIPLFLVIIAAVYVDLWLRSFVVPLMYRYRLKANAAWSRFSPLLKAHAISFLAYGLWVLLLMIGLAFAVLILILVTCCIAGILLIIPYIGTVLLLPVYVALRALSLEFMAQFGDDFKIFPEPAPAAGPAIPPPPSPGPPPNAPPAGSFEPEI